MQVPKIRRRVDRIGALMLLLAVADGAAAQTGGGRTPQTFAGAALDARLATRLARAGGAELIDFHPCAGGSKSCALIAVRQSDGEAFVYEVSDKRCAQKDASCLAGFTATNLLAKGGKPRSSASSAKVSGKPGEDGAPPDPQDQAQADATNEIIEALGDGKYEVNYDQFWKDLESIRTWTNPSWREPDPPAPVQDTLRTTGVSGRSSSAVLISGRYKHSYGTKECRRWVGYSSSTASVSNIGNWIGNAPLDGCDSEVAVFSDKGEAELVGTERRWSKHADNLDYGLGAPIRVPTTVWIVHAETDYAAEKGRIMTDFETANQILKDSRCGIELELDPEVDIHDKTAALADPAQDIGCSVETLLKPQVGFHANRMNVYVVNELVADDRAGVACTQQSDNVIVLDHGRFDTSLLHEYGHWFDLWHTDTLGNTDGPDMPLMNIRNIMSDNEKDQRNMLTAGQCYRANFSKDSYINKRGLRSGNTKTCAHLQDADGECPGLKNEF